MEREHNVDCRSGGHDCTGREGGRWAIALACLLLATAAHPLAAQNTVEDALKQRVEQLRDVGRIEVAGRTVRGSDALAALHETEGFRPIWSDGAARELKSSIRGLAGDGLNPADYHLGEIETLETGSPSSSANADLEILRSDALLRIVHDLRFGKVDPDRLTADRDLDRSTPELNILLTAQGAIRSGRISATITDLRPTHFVYTGLVAALSELRRVASAGGWEVVPRGETLRLGDIDPRVPAVRRRLVASGDLLAPTPTLGSSVATSDSTFDMLMDAGLRSFQHRHGLNEDGVLGPATLAELNVTVESRIEQLRINLERARWFAHDLPNDFVVVNVAGAKVYMVKGGDVVMEARAIVGQTQTRTPVFRSTMRYIDLNPTWTVPPGIVDEVLAAVRRDPNYLARMDMHILNAAGRRVEVAHETLIRYTPATFPYVFRQAPGAANPLGQIKFVFPNSYNVYLHDTPARALFESEQRTFSHGCIRVENPLSLAELILDDPEQWNQETLTRAIAAGGTRTIPLRSPLTVLILYWTASADLHRELHFYRDVYRRDASLLSALNRD